MTLLSCPPVLQPLLADAPMGNGEGGAAAAGAVDAMAALVANREEPLTAGNSMAGQDSVYWPKPLKVGLSACLHRIQQCCWSEHHLC